MLCEATYLPIWSLLFRNQGGKKAEQTLWCLSGDVAVFCLFTHQHQGSEEIPPSASQTSTYQPVAGRHDDLYLDLSQSRGCRVWKYHSARRVVKQKSPTHYFKVRCRLTTQRQWIKTVTCKETWPMIAAIVTSRRERPLSCCSQIMFFPHDAASFWRNTRKECVKLQPGVLEGGCKHWAKCAGFWTVFFGWVDWCLSQPKDLKIFLIINVAINFFEQGCKQ